MAEADEQRPKDEGRRTKEPIAVGDFEAVAVTFRAEADDEAVGFDVFGDDVEGGVIKIRAKGQGPRAKVSRKAVALSDGVEGDSSVGTNDTIARIGVDMSRKLRILGCTDSPVFWFSEFSEFSESHILTITLPAFSSTPNDFKKFSTFTSPTKQMPVLSGLAATGIFANLASDRTSDLQKLDRGKRTRENRCLGTCHKK